MSGQSAEARRVLRMILRVLLAALYVGFGILHLTKTQAMVPIVPGWVSDPVLIVRFTGYCEIAGGLGLLLRPTRTLAGIMLALYAVCVYPANLHHAFGDLAVKGLPSSWWYHGPRLLFQPVFVWWALFVGDVINWPFKPAANAQRSDQFRGEGSGR